METIVSPGASYCGCLFLCLWSLLLFWKPALSQDVECQGHVIQINVTSAGGVLYSPGYPEDYRNSDLCSWLLTAREVGHVLQLRPLDLHVGHKANRDGECVGDELTAYDGNSYKHEVLRRWCGRDESVAHSSTEAVLLQLRTNRQRRYRGFAIRYSLTTLSDNKCRDNSVKTIPLGNQAVVADFKSPSWSYFQHLPSTCSWRLVADDVTHGVVIDLESFGNGLPCEDGNFSVYDGPVTSSPEIIRWCARGTKPFTSVFLSGGQGMVVIRTKPNVTSTMRFRFYAAPKQYSKCTQEKMPTLELQGREPTYLTFPFAVNASGASCPLRLLSGLNAMLWARVDVLEVNGQPATCTRTGPPFIVRQANETDGNIQGMERVSPVCWRGDHPVYWPVAESVIISPTDPSARMLLKVTASMEGACHGRLQRRLAYTDEVLVIRHPPLSSRALEYGSSAWCRFVVEAESETDHVLSRVEGELCEMEAGCNDYVKIYDGSSTDSPVLYDSRNQNHLGAYVVSTGRQVTYEVVTDEKDNRGFIQASFNPVPVTDLCNDVKNIKADRTPRNLSSINYPHYYPVNYMCQYCISPEIPTDVIYINVVDSDLTYSCADSVEVFDGPDSETAVDYLGRFCGRDTPSFTSKQAGLCLLFRSDPTMHGRGWLLTYRAVPTPTDTETKVTSAYPSVPEPVSSSPSPLSSASSSTSSESPGTVVIVLAVLLAIVSVALIALLVVIIVVFKIRQGRASAMVD